MVHSPHRRLLRQMTSLSLHQVVTTRNYVPKRAAAAPAYRTPVSLLATCLTLTDCLSPCVLRLTLALDSGC